MLWRIVRGLEISAAHHIEGHPKCGETHGHNYQLTVYFNFNGWIDFLDLKKLCDDVVNLYDHKDLGNRTLEELSKSIRENLISQFKERFKQRLKDIRIEIYETQEFGIIICGGRKHAESM